MTVDDVAEFAFTALTSLSLALFSIDFVIRKMRDARDAGTLS